MIPEFVKLLDRMKEIHNLKNEDYATKGNDFENFIRAAIISEWFDDPMDKVFVTLIAVKLARMAVLRNKKTTPNNESVLDTMLDLPTYCGLWSSWVERNQREEMKKYVNQERS